MMLNMAVFATGLTAVIAIVVLSLLKFVKSDFQFWPPPSPGSWQHRVFRAFFRIFFYSLVALSYFDFHPSAPWKYMIGGLLLIAGFGSALRWTSFLGWRNSFGEPTGLKTKGPFIWSRNPIYVVSMVGMIGWAMVVNSVFLSILLGIWALLYIFAPILEEPWLEREFGNEYRNYMKRTPRYF